MILLCFAQVQLERFHTAFSLGYVDLLQIRSILRVIASSLDKWSTDQNAGWLPKLKSRALLAWVLLIFLVS